MILNVVWYVLLRSSLAINSGPDQYCYEGSPVQRSGLAN